MQPVAAFFEGLNWDNRPLASTLSMADFNLFSAGGLFLTQSVGQFFAALNWSGSRLQPESMPEDPFTLEDFAALFGGALL